MLKIFLCTVLVFWVWGCGSKKDSASEVTYEYNGKSAEQFFKQFYVEVQNCEATDKSGMLKFQRLSKSLISSDMELNKTSVLEAKLYLSRSQFEVQFEALKNIEKTNSGYGEPPQGLKESVYQERVSGKIQMIAGQLQLIVKYVNIGSIANGLMYQGEDTLQVQFNENILKQLSEKASADLAHFIGEAFVATNSLIYLSDPEKELGCNKGAESLAFNLDAPEF